MIRNMSGLNIIAWAELAQLRNFSFIATRETGLVQLIAAEKLTRGQVTFHLHYVLHSVIFSTAVKKTFCI